MVNGNVVATNVPDSKWRSHQPRRCKRIVAGPGVINFVTKTK